MKKLIVTVLGLSTALWLCAADEDPFKSKKERVSYTIRKGLVRFGFHYFNDEGDVERVIAIARESAA